MPYFVYAVRPFAQLEKLGEHAAFRDGTRFAQLSRSDFEGVIFIEAIYRG